eukprot:1046439-Pyramimonas_sp.AAC.2
MESLLTATLFSPSSHSHFSPPSHPRGLLLFQTPPPPPSSPTLGRNASWLSGLKSKLAQDRIQRLRTPQGRIRVPRIEVQVASVMHPLSLRPPPTLDTAPAGTVVHVAKRPPASS